MSAMPSAAVPLRILLIEDSEDDAFLMLRRFREAGYRLHSVRVETADDMRRELQTQVWDVVLSDHSMPHFSALAALRLMQEVRLDLPFIIVSGVINEETAIAAMRAGAHDYLSKNHLDRLVPAVEREMREAHHRAERRLALEAVQESEARFRALAANIPGMVFQALREPDGRLVFLYVSDGCQFLLGVKPLDLLAAPNLFVNMILADDRRQFIAAMERAVERFNTFNWEGRILVAGDEKWVNMRCSPRRMESGAVQWEGIVSNISHGKRAEQEARESRAQLAELSSHLEIVIEEERERIARDIHDELGGTLVAIKFEVALLSARIPQEEIKLKERAGSIGKLVDGAIGTAGRVARELRPGILKEFGLAAAIETHAGDFSQRTGLVCDILCSDHDLEPDQDTSVALFRVFQEALTNISKHAHASRVDVRLVQQGEEILLEIADDGRGLDPEDLKKPKSFGLRGIRERLKSLGGSFYIGPGEKGGTRIMVRAPLHESHLDKRNDAG